MDVLARITKLKDDRKWTNYELAVKSGLAPTTVASWFKRNLIPTLPSLINICEAFGISISEFFMDENSTMINISAQQKRLLNVISKYDSEKIDKLIVFLESEN